jgi:hypothetical protein
MSASIPFNAFGDCIWGVFRNPLSLLSPKLLHLRARSASSRVFRKELRLLKNS